MSSFICSPKHYNSIERKLIYELVDRGNKELEIPYEIRKSMPVFTPTDISKIVDTIRELNVLCVSLQYKHHYEGVLDNEIETQKLILTDRRECADLTIHGLYNAMRCAIYQIEIRHLKELRETTEQENKAMIFFDEMINKIAHHLVRKMPEDKSNCWSL